MRCLLCFFVLLGALCCIGPASALIISMSKSHYYAARGSNVKLACHYTLALDVTQYIEIIWSVVSAKEDEKTILWFTDGRLNADLYKPLEGRVHFTSPDPQNGDASIIISDVRLSDSETYRCFVKNLPELDHQKMDLTVVDPLSQQTDVDNPLSLTTTAVAAIAVFVTITVLGTVAIAVAFSCYRKKKSLETSNIVL
ncbi:coxsackievirus and adenovirus receptor homolog [Phyllopteryx taeniolatus]|uniref:coxsackievirus and adenovirus receptor homolog n=1 Tax=Phyllopteryx taeniolatus TaxID=161469 RepID=UPI002AD2D581|nr:coxsackievirus and adenovirus receptor homolog [Phyllopteryx taeniolatus]XP_061653307.1 coxsackievirus and adenovirus receptor homolog [Phyllopteryx taeniolatus]